MNNATVAMFRFTPRVSEVTEFYERLGLRRELAADSGQYVELRALTGRLHLHAGEDVDTTLQFQVPLAVDAARALEADGLDCLLWDEAYGHQLALLHPSLGKVWICERQQDMYGYTGFDAEPSHVGVVSIVFSDDFARDVAFFAHLGFTPDGPGDEHWQGLAAGEGQGYVGLHAPEADSPSVALSLTSGETLVDLELRLQQAGMATRTYVDEFISYVAVTDPDGIEVQIHVAPSA